MKSFTSILTKDLNCTIKQLVDYIRKDPEYAYNFAGDLIVTNDFYVHLCDGFYNIEFEGVSRSGANKILMNKFNCNLAQFWSDHLKQPLKYPDLQCVMYCTDCCGFQFVPLEKVYLCPRYEFIE